MIVNVVSSQTFGQVKPGQLFTRNNTSGHMLKLAVSMGKAIHLPSLTIATDELVTEILDVIQIEARPRR